MTTTDGLRDLMNPFELAGGMYFHRFTSDLLDGNPLGDPTERPLWVYVPPGYDSDPSRRYRSVYVLLGYSGQLTQWLTHAPHRHAVPELIDEVFRDPDTPPAVVVFVDAWTRFGGSQFLDSPGTGRYHSYLCNEIVPWVDAHYRTVPERQWRTVTGKSSGGYGAMVTAMLRPDLFSGLATHAGDALFDTTYRASIPTRARALRDEYGGSWPAFLAGLEGRVFGTRASDGDLLEIYAYASAYSADDDGAVHVPFDESGLFVEDVWRRWLAHDPVVMAARPDNAAALASMTAMWIDAGASDEYFLDLGAEAFRRAALAAGAAPDRMHFELFPGTHAAIEYRYADAIRWLCQRIGQVKE